MDAGAPRDGGVDAGSSGGGAGGGSSGGSAGGTCTLPPLPVNATIFVQPDGGSDSNLGDSPASPVQTLGAALLRAETRSGITIALQPGTYAEDVTLGIGLSSDSIVGAVTPTWQRDCDPAARTRTIIATPSPQGVLISGNTGIALSLSHLTVRSANATQPSESSYAVRVLNSRVILSQVHLIAGRGADGGVAAPPSPAGGAVVCQGEVDCGLPSPGDAGTSGLPSDGGFFSMAGFVAGRGGDGTTGRPGGNGVLGLPGQTRSGCVLACGGVTPCMNNMLLCPTTTGTVDAGVGRCGCGGLGGGAGQGGPGGGSSVALFISGTSAVTLTSSLLQSSAAGHGGLPSSGGTGAAGGAGVDGASARCAMGPCTRQQCSEVCAPSSPGDVVPGGPAGSPGGPGGPGGNGGAGAGGSSIPLVTVGVSPQNFTSSGVTFIPGPAGGAVGGARPGLVLNQLVLP